MRYMLDTNICIYIIKIAKKKGYYIPKPDKKNHDRNVNTNYIGELVQHDTTHHLFAPYAERKWYLITSIDDFSRYLLYRELMEKETSVRHIEAFILQIVFPQNCKQNSPLLQRLFLNIAIKKNA